MQGFGTGPFEMLVPSSIGDMYFVHQRGSRIAIQAMAMFGVSFLTPILTGVITDRMYLLSPAVLTQVVAVAVWICCYFLRIIGPFYHLICPGTCL
jgi:MFS family permease